MKKAICIALGLLMLSTVFLSACDEKGTGKVTSGSVSTTSNGLNVADVPIQDYGGKTLTFLTCGVNQAYESEIVYNEELEKMSTVVNEAIQRRNQVVEERFNVEIKETYVYDLKRKNGEFVKAIRNNAAAGTNDFQVVVPCIYDGATLAASGLLHDLYSVPYLSMSKPWWDQAFNKELTINNKLYFTVGDIGVINKGATAALMFNKQLIKDHNLENPYDLVRIISGRWTKCSQWQNPSALTLTATKKSRIKTAWAGPDSWTICGLCSMARARELLPSVPTATHAYNV
jgi:hypothetical protein